MFHSSNNCLVDLIVTSRRAGMWTGHFKYFFRLFWGTETILNWNSLSFSIACSCSKTAAQPWPSFSTLPKNTGVDTTAIRLLLVVVKMCVERGKQWVGAWQVMMLKSPAAAQGSHRLMKLLLSCVSFAPRKANKSFLCWFVNCRNTCCN